MDLIRTIAIVGVILLHAANDLTAQQMSSVEIYRWCTVDVYQSLGRTGVPLFIMLTGFLLLQPSKVNESLSVFFKKRVSRIALPLVFWGILYFAWDFFVDHQVLTPSFVVQGVLTGPYFQFWYIYMLIGLYLLTPFLRILVANANKNLFKYFVVLWLVGSAGLPLLGLVSAFKLDPNVLTIPGYVGYFVLGIYLVNSHVKRSILAGFMVLGVALTAIGTYIIAATIGGGTMYFFQEYLSPTMILTSVMLFMLLTNGNAPANKIEMPQNLGDNKMAGQENKSASLGSRILKLISENTLPIFLFHMMVIVTLQSGYLGITINGNTINSIIGVPLMTALTLAICLAVIVPLKKVPVLKKLIG